ncbi:hypothetical protein [Oceanomicrobium pacificus]|uniref:Uncharacterized protein n=1 Tax=Oceanomicrobium pacificus TaxID=2692916 RepID=A0A6B0TY18_9RHOB|nr:hypothetical protein [Oceanomicrobium pacificus]MXU63811.1 hypothetical protein [Oceanomicrobium pacificus]
MFGDFSIKHADTRTKSDTRRNLTITLVISFLPLIAGFVLFLIGATSSPDGEDETGALGILGSAIKTVFLSGELYFYAISLCASIYIVSQSATQASNHGMRLWSGLFVVVCAVFMALFVGAGEVDASPGVSMHGILSVLFLLSAVLLNYRVQVLADQPPPMPEDVNREEAQSVTNNADPNYD